MKDRLIELIKAFYMVGQPLYIITEERKVVMRVVRSFEYLDDLGIEFECTIWRKDRKGVSQLETNIVHSTEIGKSAFQTQEEAERALKEARRQK